MRPDDKLTLKVAARFAAGPKPMKEEKMLLLLGKLRKMKEKSSIQGKEMSQIFNFLGGWKVEEGKAFENPRKKSFYAGDKLVTEVQGDIERVQGEWDKVKKGEVDKLPNADSMSVGKSVYLDVTDIRPVDGKMGFSYTEMKVYSTVVITSPDHKSFSLLDRDLSQWPSEYMTNAGVLKWLNTTNFYDQLNSKLGTVSIEEERELAKKKIPTRDNTGTCGACFGNFKLTKAAKHGKDRSLPGMVLHGYQRPGHGYINGNCMGQDWPPFELSKECTEATLENRENGLKMVRAKLHTLKTNPPEEITILGVISQQPQTIRKSEDEREWDRQLKYLIRRTEMSEKELEDLVVFLKANLRGWKVKPLPGTGPTP